MNRHAYAGIAALAFCLSAARASAQLDLNSQDGDNTCWAAAAAMVLGQGECLTVKQGFSACSCLAGGEKFDGVAACDEGSEWINDVLPDVVKGSCIRTAERKNALTGYPKLSELAAHDPVLLWDKTISRCGKGHMVVADAEVPGAPAELAMVLDPWPVGRGQIRWSTCREVGGGLLGQGQCGYYYDMGQPKQPLVEQASAPWSSAGSCEVGCQSWEQLRAQVEGYLTSATVSGSLLLAPGVLTCQKEFLIEVAEDARVVASGARVRLCTVATGGGILLAAEPAGDCLRLLWFGSSNLVAGILESDSKLGGGFDGGRLRFDLNKNELSVRRGGQAIKTSPGSVVRPLIEIENESLRAWIDNRTETLAPEERSWGAPIPP